MPQYDIVKSWLANVSYSHSNSKLTKHIYKRQLRLFTQFVGKTPQQILADYERMGDRKFRKLYAQYLRNQIAEMVDEGYAPNTINSLVTAVKSFFRYNDLPLGYVAMSKGQIVYHNRDITREELAHILARVTLRDKAIFSMMAQGGLRPGVMGKLRYESIKDEFEAGVVPLSVRIPSELSKGSYGSYFTFVGPEAIHYLKLYLSGRGNLQPDDYLFTSQTKRGKPLHPKVMSKIFNERIRKLEKKGLIEIKNRQYNRPAEVRLYNLRKFFRKHAGQAGIEYVNFWMGHKTNYRAPHIPASDVHYFDTKDIEFHRKLYAEKAMPHLRIDAATPIETESLITDLQRQLAEKDRRIQELENFKTSVETRLDDLKKAEDYIRSVHEEMKSFEEDGATIVYLKDKVSEKEAKEILHQAVHKKKGS